MWEEGDKEEKENERRRKGHAKRFFLRNYGDSIWKGYVVYVLICQMTCHFYISVPLIYIYQRFLC